jgi:Fic family protein
MLEGIRETANWSNTKIHAIRDLLDATSSRMRRELPKIYSRELAEVIFVNPYCRISNVVSAGIAKRQAAAVYLKALADAGILTEIRAGRENLYINPALLELLTEHRPR